MKGLMDKYKVLSLMYVKQFYKYPIPLFIKLINVPAEIFIYIFLWVSLGKARQLDINYMITYYIMVGLLKNAYPFRHISLNIEQDVIEGSILNHLIRPYPYILPEICKYSAWTCLYSIVFLPFIVFVSIYKHVLLYSVLLFAISLIVGNIIQFLIWYNVGLLALRIERIRGIIVGVSALMAFTSGSLLPLNLFPGWMEQITYFLPFRYFIYFPLETILGNESISSYVISLGISMVWCFLLLGLSKVLWKNGMKNVRINCT